MAIEWTSEWLVTPWGGSAWCRADLHPCGDCGCIERLLYQTPRKVQEGTETLQGNAACPRCIPVPDNALVWGTLDVLSETITLFEKTGGEAACTPSHGSASND